MDELKVKIVRPKNMSSLEAEELIYKALDFNRSGDAHEDGFLDPAMNHLAALMQEEYKLMIDNINREIDEELDGIY